VAVVSGDNPWALQACNQLPGGWAALPGDVLFTPAQQATGPGALPSPLTAFNVDGGAFIQGKTAVLRATGSESFALGGEWIEKTIHFFPSEGNLVALQGTPLTAENGTFPLTISGTTAEGAPFGFTQFVRVQSGNYPTESLSLTDLSTLDSEISNAESARITGMVLEATPEKRWSGYWGAPHPYIDVINSEFGVRRNYNQGAYEGFHYGVDFGGGVGIEVWAPAAGEVVFAGLLDVRGNVTIIDHGWGIYTGYFHQSEILVEVGQQVSPGTLIGRVGNTGRSTGAHLHWEVWAGGVAVEPMDWLAFVYP
jgi:murein DD-endopeptidase MepM/ murein hydrolase activator NlpD